MNPPMFPFTVVLWKVAGKPRAQKKTSYYNFLKSGILFLAFSFFSLLDYFTCTELHNSSWNAKKILFISLNYFIWNFILAWIFNICAKYENLFFHIITYSVKYSKYLFLYNQHSVINIFVSTKIINESSHKEYKIEFLYHFKIRISVDRGITSVLTVSWLWHYYYISYSDNCIYKRIEL